MIIQTYRGILHNVKHAFGDIHLYCIIVKNKNKFYIFPIFVLDIPLKKNYFKTLSGGPKPFSELLLIFF